MTSPKTVYVGGLHDGFFYVNDIFSVETAVNKYFEVCYFVYGLFRSDDRHGTTELVNQNGLRTSPHFHEVFESVLPFCLIDR